MKNDISNQLKTNIKDYYSKYYGGILEDGKQYTCPNPAHADHKPSATYYENQNGIFCHVCHKTYDIFNLIAFNEHLDPKDAFKKACELYQNNKKDKTKFDYWHKALMENKQAKDFIFSRGFNEDTLKRFNIGYAEDYGNIVIPITAKQYTTRNLENDKDKREYKKINGGEDTALFNGQVVSTTTDKDICFVSEGEFDAMSFEQIGVKAIALRSTENIRLLFDTIKNKNITFVLALDNDQAGRECRNELHEKLIKLGFAEPIDFDLGIYKDPNEMLVKAPKEFTKQAHAIVDSFKLKNSPQETPQNTQDKEKINSDYDSKSNLCLLKDFFNFIEDNKNNKPISTGFKRLDNILDGGIRSGIYVIGAISSIGKTTFTMQIADHVAKHDNDVIIFSLEMTRRQLIAKSLSRITYEHESKIDRKCTGDILHAHHYSTYDDHDKNVIKRSVQKYSEFAKNIFTFENENGTTAEMIYKSIDNHIRQRNKIPVVIIDFMQLISATSEKFSDKQNMDKLMTIIKQCTTKFNVPVILISSLNREGYTQKISLQSLKESGGIEYCAEVILGLQFRDMGKDFDIDEAKARNPREIEMIVLKNRFGMTGTTINYDFYPEYNYFEEERENDTTGYAKLKSNPF